MSFRDVEKSLSDIRKTSDIDGCYERNRQLESEVEELRTKNVDLGNQFRHFLDLKNDVISEYRRLEIMYNRKRYSLKQFDALVQRKVMEECQEKIQEGIEERWERYSPIMKEIAVLTEIRKYPNDCKPSVRRTLDSLLGIRRNTLKYVPAKKDP